MAFAKVAEALASNFLILGWGWLSTPVFGTLRAAGFGTGVEMLTQVVLFILRREGVGESVAEDIFHASWDWGSGGFADGGAG